MPARTLNPAPSRDGVASPVEAVICVRVSSKDQEEEGFSIQAQLRLLREYAANQRMVIGKEFVDVESAKEGDRNGFSQMVQYLTSPRATCRTILVEKTDRLYRNPKDWVTLDELDVEIHFVKENRIISRESRSSEKFMHGMHVLMAKHYIDNLSEETRKGMLEKARSGIYPSYAPLGYRNTEGPGGKRIIVPDGQTSLIVQELYKRFAPGTLSLEALAAELRGEEVTLRGRPLGKSLVHQILRKRLYMGEFDWDGVTYQGSHEPLVTRECWEQVQQVLDQRAENKTRKVKHDFAFTGLVHCGHCGCHLVGELKKGRYVYYHCTGNRGKCPEPYTRQEKLSSEFGQILEELVIPPAVLDWLQSEVAESDRSEQATRQQAIQRLHVRHDQVQTRLETMYVDKLEGRITPEFYDRQAEAWRKEQQTIFRNIQEIQKAAPAQVDQAVDALELTSRACRLFREQTAVEQRRLLRLLVKEATWLDGGLRTSLFEPFEILRRSNQESTRKERENSGSGQDLQIWLLR
jgi:site-specific DNA recombinase